MDKKILLTYIKDGKEGFDWFDTVNRVWKIIDELLRKENFIMNRLEKIISADIRNTEINKKDLDYYLDSEQTEYACKKDDEVIYVFTVYKNGEECAVNKYICDEDEDTLGSLEEMEILKSEGYVIEAID